MFTEMQMLNLHHAHLCIPDDGQNWYTQHTFFGIFIGDSQLTHPDNPVLDLRPDTSYAANRARRLGPISMFVNSSTRVKRLNSVFLHDFGLVLAYDESTGSYEIWRVTPR